MAEEKSKDESKKKLLPHIRLPRVNLPHIGHPHIPSIHFHAPSGKTLLHRLFRMISPAPLIGGLDISNSAIRFIRIEGDRLRQASETLMPGIIEDGKIKDKNGFIKALEKVHSQIVRPKEVVQIILLIPSSDVYTEVFKLPFLSEDELREAAKLNLQMISPLEIESSYADAEEISDIGEGGQIEFLGAFANRAIVDEYMNALTVAKFAVVAVEFSGLALARLIRELGPHEKQDSFSVGIMLFDDGFQFFLLKSGNLYFHYFVPLKPKEDGKSRSINIDDIKEVLVAETEKVFNFASSHWSGESIQKFIVITPSAFQEISETLGKNFSLPVVQLSLAKFGDAQPSAFPVLGSAIRGALPRSSDKSISLTAVGTERGYEEHRLLYFASVWRNVIVTFVAFFAIVYGVAYWAISGYAQSVSVHTVKSDTSSIQKEITPIQNDAKEFNRILSLYSKMKTSVHSISSPIDNLFTIFTAGGVSIQRLSLDTSGNVNVSGLTSTDVAISNLKQKLESQSGFQNVSLPLSSITRSKAGITFQVQLKIAR